MAVNNFKTLSRVESTRQKLAHRRKRRVPPASRVRPRGKAPVSKALPAVRLTRKRRKKVT